MDAQMFVAALKKAVDNGVDNELSYLNGELPANAPRHLSKFSNLVRALPSEDQSTLEDLIRFVAEGTLFRLLVLLDNQVRVTEENGILELWYSAEGGERLLLNSDEGELLNEIFNSIT